MNPLQTLRRAQNKVKREGAANSFMQVFLRIESYLFDYQYGVDTYRNVPLSDLNIKDPSIAYGRRYQPVLVSHLKAILRKIEPTPNDVLVDFGAGKGRVLLISSLYPFKRVVGVEFSHELCAIAQKNQEIFKQGKDICPIEVHCVDAAAYQIHPEENVFFFFNPFDTVVMDQVIKNIESSHSAHTRKIRIVFINLESQPVESVSNLFVRVTNSKLHGLPFQIYESKAV